MTSKGLLRLVLLTGLVLAAWFVVRPHTDASGQGADTEGPWLPGLQAALDEVVSIELLVTGESLRLTKSADGWGLETWGGYPADSTQVASTLLGLAGLKDARPMTSQPAKHAALQLEDPTHPGATSLGLRVSDAAGTPLADVVLGRSKGQDGLFVRRTHEHQAWQVRGRLAPPRALSGWVQTELLRLPADGMARVEAEPVDDEPWSLVRSDDGAWSLEQLPPGREPASSAPGSAVAGALAWLDLESVADAEQAAAERRWSTLRFVAQDGLVAEVQAAPRDDGQGAWVRLSFSARRPGLDALSARVDELNARHGPWTYAVTSWSADALSKRLADFLEPLPEPAASSAPPPSADDPPSVTPVAEETAGAAEAGG
ncbi:MAG: hypothetical protein DRQ55_07045 [Planctomycetota bacterium]|nr:MAG: hypothetical protein DRQ55_07045 [Planctomycetota bacterium]